MSQKESKSKHDYTREMINGELWKKVKCVYTQTRICTKNLLHKII